MARRRKLSPERKAFIDKLIAHYNPKDVSDVQEMLKDLLGDTLQDILEAEWMSTWVTPSMITKIKRLMTAETVTAVKP